MWFRAVLFDAAETLFKTRGTVGEIYGAVAREFGSTAPDTAIQASFKRHFQHGGPLLTAEEKQWWKGIVRSVFEEVGMIRDFDSFFDKVYDGFRDSQTWTLFPETVEVLDNLKRRGFKLGVISNFDSRIYSVMESLGILHFFDSVTISSETGFAKPSRHIFRSAVASLGLPPSQILIVGDSLEDDVEAGLSAGLHGALLDRNNQHLDVPHVIRITDLRQIIALLSAPAQEVPPS